jgi:predicted transcriptional regulator
MKLSKPVQDLLLYTYRKGEITNSKSGMLAMSFYAIISYLKSLELLEAIETTDRNEKIWRLTNKGKGISFHLCELDDIAEGRKVYEG